MNEAPKKIWIKVGVGAQLHAEYTDYRFKNKYIRADLVDGLVEALELMLDWFGYPPDYECWRSDKARAALAALKEEE